MVKVVAHPGQSTESLIRQFGKKVLSEGILTDWKKKEFFKSSSELRKEKKEAQRKRWPR